MASLPEYLTRLHDVQKIDGMYRVQQLNGMCLAMPIDDWREALRLMEELESQPTGDWLE